MTAYLTSGQIVTTGLILGVWTLLAIAFGVALGNAIRRADEAELADWEPHWDTVAIPRAETDDERFARYAAGRQSWEGWL